MSMDKSIANGNEKRKKYYDSRAFDHTCRNHGSCSRCNKNRTYSTRKKLIKVMYEIRLTNHIGSKDELDAITETT